MSFETISLLLNWVQLGVLLAILFRLGIPSPSSPTHNASLDERSIVQASSVLVNSLA